MTGDSSPAHRLGGQLTPSEGKLPGDENKVMVGKQRVECDDMVTERTGARRPRRALNRTRPRRRRPRPREFLPAFSIVPNRDAGRKQTLRRQVKLRNRGGGRRTRTSTISGERLNRHGRNPAQSGASDQHFRQTLRAGDHGVVSGC